LLLIDDPAAANIRLCTAGVAYNPTVAAFAQTCNAFQGRRVGNNSMLFLGVPVLPPGTTGVRQYRITNIRANASAVTSPGSGIPGNVQALISATPAQTGLNGAIVISPTFPVDTPQQTIGFVQSGLASELRFPNGDGSFPSAGFGFQQCINKTTSDNATTGRQNSGIARLRFTEGFATSFKTRTSATDPAGVTSPAPVPQTVPGFPYNSESGYYNPGLAFAGVGATAGLADFGTRLKATFAGVPNGVRLFVSVQEIAATGGNRARLVGSETAPYFATPTTTIGTFGYVYPSTAAGVTGINVAEVTLVNGTGVAVWEVTAHDPLQIGRLEFTVHAAYTSLDLANNLPAPGTATVSQSFAPTAPSFPASDGANPQPATFPIPRFVDTSTARNLFRLNVCLTNLLFPFVTNQAGFDTGLAIANTSRDPFGTSVQSGTCTLNAYGANAPAAITSPTVTPDAIYTALASTAMPNFQGYVIAQCRFQFAHGFAFISDLGARNLAMGYLALVIPADTDGTRAADPLSASAEGTGEQLGN
jgi:hypothetical protein